jgi:hypothetical protein
MFLNLLSKMLAEGSNMLVHIIVDKGEHRLQEVSIFPIDLIDL